MDVTIHPMPTAVARAFRAGAPDANGQLPERATSDGGANPCRHCLRMIPEGAGMLILAWRPFSAPQPYAEVGPVFLCAADCAAWEGEGIPPALASPEYLVKGYSAGERIVYGTGGIVPVGDIPARAAALLAEPRVAFVDIRSARNNCFQARVTRSGEAPPAL
ncbi:DUF1203 domain-containing protein [Pseudooceanicola sp. 216_PA32_1]|jgi:hypothetical protein|uniref:DUF1203 domain-containing protein n=1 Tax=Pseudooceanicola pacificus TaxID=2676438 RepID=A0A844W250_9RHOB|nr:DUF1203 domain-containing protein [Pseudooceanicola pacificus]MWB76764.1 DUF1203 domain-containing protein [Pseudooceanicola pacificus]